jgi:hypothetical protein
MMHTVACLWILIGNSLDESWIWAAGMTSSPRPDVYITSLYWVITTLTTVGYGDIKGNTYQEYLFTMVIEVR